jgi:hypothetical protein
MMNLFKNGFGHLPIRRHCFVTGPSPRVHVKLAKFYSFVVISRLYRCPARGVSFAGNGML